jgi:hypothetical protein
MSAKLAPAGGIDWGIVLASVLVVDVLHEQQHVVLVLDGSHAASADSDAHLLDKLRLKEGAYFKRATALLFAADPQRFVTGAFVKVGFFESETELLHHDEVEGDLFHQVKNTLDLLLTKYLKAVISYDGIVRVETFPVPRAALREALLNALVHRDYAVTAPVQIRVYENRLRMWNPAVLPEGWTLDTLLGAHSSSPYNLPLPMLFSGWARSRPGAVGWSGFLRHARRLARPNQCCVTTRMTCGWSFRLIPRI